MAKPLIMEIPHELGQEEAKRRLVEGTDKGKELLGKTGIAVDTMQWTDNHLDFAVSALGQKIAGTIDVNPETVRLEAQMPLIFSLFVSKIQQIAGSEGTKLLAKK